MRERHLAGCLSRAGYASEASKQPVAGAKSVDFDTALTLRLRIVYPVYLNTRLLIGWYTNERALYLCDRYFKTVVTRFKGDVSYT